MKLSRILVSLGCLLLAPPLYSAAQEADKLLFADFETLKENRVVSNGGGLVQLFSYEETNKARFKGAAGTNAPEAVHLKAGDPNRAVAFDFEIPAPNQYAGVGLQVYTAPDKEGKPAAIDVSNYKYVTFQFYAKGAENARIESVSRGQGLSISQGDPQATFKVKPGFNTYQIALKSLLQPQWAQVKVSTKDVLKKLTQVNIAVYCDRCTPMNGTVVVDNVVFQN
jgi:hypothetical protein